MRTRLAVAALTAIVVAGGGSAAGSPTGAVPDDYQRAYRIGLDAYVYGLPLVTTNQTFLTMTSTDVSQGAYGPVNQFNNVGTPNNAGSTAVVAPGSTSLSSIAWLDLTQEPQVLHVPAVSGHFFVLAFVDPYTTNVVNLGTASRTAPGDYVVCGPGQRGVALPSGTRRIDVDYSRIWIIGSTQLRGAGDIPAVNAIQAQYRLTPLSGFVAGAAPAPTPGPVATAPTITQYAVPTGLAFFDLLGSLLQQFPPPPRDASALARFASVGIGPGRAVTAEADLSADTLRGLADAVAAGPVRVRRDTAALFAAGFDRHNGYLLGGFGRYGVDYARRAVISQIGLGAFTPHQAIYAMTWTDRAGKPLSGSARYVLHLSDPPPTNEGWSLTVYDAHGALMANPLGRYAFTDTSALTRNPDGSVDIYLQSTAPTDASRRSNWLPVAAGQRFQATWRLFAPKPPRIAGILAGRGWLPPAITLRR